MSEEWVGLAEAIARLRSELAACLEAGEDERVRFELGPVELEFTVDVRRSGGADAGIRWGVVSAGARGELARATGHRLRLTLQPKDVLTGRNAEVASPWNGEPDLDG